MNSQSKREACRRRSSRIIPRQLLVWGGGEEEVQNQVDDRSLARSDLWILGFPSLSPKHTKAHPHTPAGRRDASTIMKTGKPSHTSTSTAKVKEMMAATLYGDCNKAN